MKRKSLPIPFRRIPICAALLATALIATQACAARTVAQWQALFDNSWSSEFNTYNPLSISGDSWHLYNLAYGIDANYAMFRASGQTKYLNRALLYIQNTINTSRVSSSFASSQFKDSYRTWVNRGNDGKEYPLYESYCWRYVTSVLRVMKTTPSIYNDPAYRAKYDSILAFTERNIWEKWYVRGTGNLYRQNTHMASHWAKIALDLNIISTDAAKKVQYVAVRDNINHLGLPGYGSDTGLRGQMVTQASPARFFWNQNWGSFSTPGQDVAHGNAVVGYVAEAKDLGYHWTSADVAKFVATHNFIWPSATTYRNYVNGTGNGTGWFNDGWVKLGRYSSALQTRLESHNVGRNTQFYGNGALNAFLLAR